MYIFRLMAAFVLVIVGLFFWSRSEEGGVAFDRQVFRVPLLGDTLLKFQASQFCRTLSTLLTGGTPLVAALPTAAGSISSRFVRGSGESATQKGRAGGSLHSAPGSGQGMPEP